MHKESFKYEEEVLHFKLGKYDSGAMAVQVLDASNSPYAVLSVNLPELPTEGAFWMKTWSENEPLAKFLLARGYVEVTGRMQPAGRVWAYEARLTKEGLTKFAAVYDPKETDELMTKQLAERDDYGTAPSGDPSQAYHDYPEDSNTVKPWSPSRHQQELWNRFREWWTNTWKKKKDHEDKARVGKERGKNDPEKGEQVGTQGEGFWAYKNTPYTAPVQSPAFFMAMPAMKIGKLDTSGATLEDLKDHLIETIGSINREAIDQYDDHHVSVTFEFMLNEVRVECNWDAKDLPEGVTEVEALARVVKFLESKLPPAFLKFRQARVEDLDLPNRMITMVIPKGER